MEKIKEYLKRSSYYNKLEWGKLDLAMLVQKVGEEMPDSYTDEMFYDRLAHRSGSLSNMSTEYDRLGSMILSLLHESNTPSTFLEVVDLLQANKDIMGRERPILSPEFVSFIRQNAVQVERIYQENKGECFLPSLFGWKTLVRSYLLTSNGNVVERLPHMLFRVALFIHKDDWEKTTTCFRDLLNGKYTHATPTLFHAGTRRSQMASCFLPDTLVWTTKGTKKMKEVNIGDEVFTHTGRIQKVKQIHINHRNDRRLFKLFSAYRYIATATEDHEFMVFDSSTGKIKWKALKDIQKRDYIMQSHHHPMPFSFHTQDQADKLDKVVEVFLEEFPRVAGNMLGQIYQSNKSFSDIKISFSKDALYETTRDRLSQKGISVDSSRSSIRELILNDPMINTAFAMERVSILKWVLRNTYYDFYHGMIETMKVGSWETFSEEEADLLHILLNHLSDEEWVVDKHRVVMIPPPKTSCFCNLPPKITIDGKKFVLFGKRVRSKADERIHPFVHTLGVEHDHSYSVNGLIAKNCFLLGTEDSVDGIFKTISDCAQISKWAGGIGIHISNIRSNKSYIYGTNGRSNGILPMLKVYNDVSRYIDQCFTPDVLLVSKKGMVPIGDVKEGDLILSAEGEFQPVKKVVIHPWDGKMYSINGWNVTPEHNFLIYSPDGTQEYKSLYEVSHDEYVMFPNISFYKKEDDEFFTNERLNTLIEHIKNKDIDMYMLKRIRYVSSDKQRWLIEKVESVLNPLSMEENVFQELAFLKILVGWEMEEKGGNYIVPIRDLSIKETTYTGELYDLEMEGDPSYVTVIGSVHNGGGKRNGAFAMYIEPWHADIFDFINAKRNVGAEDERARDLFYGLWIPDLFMERVERDQEWSLFCPSVAPGLSDKVGNDFKVLYETYEKENRFQRKVRARELWTEILRSQIETGTPYMLYKDACNLRSNQQNLGVIKSSNLCVAGDTRIMTPHGLVSIKDSIGETELWNGTEFTTVDVCKTGVNQELVRVAFSNGNHMVCTPYHKFYIVGPNGQEQKVDAQVLKQGDTIATYSLPKLPALRSSILTWVQEKGVFIDDKIHLYSADKESLREFMMDLQTVGLVSEIHTVKEDRHCLRMDRHSFRNLEKGEWESQQVSGLTILSVRSVAPGDTYCFQEKKTGKGWFDGVVTGQCTEIIEYSDENEYACCNLASIALPRFLKENPLKHRMSGAIAYTKKECPFCRLLELEYPGIQKINVEDLPEEEWSQIKEQFNIKTVPAVFIGDTFVGGFTDVWKTYLCPVFDFDELYRITYATTENLNKVIDLNIYPVPETETSNKKHRPIGIGVQGLADVFGRMRMAFDETDAQELNKVIFETMYYGALKASCDLARRDGPYSSFKGSPLSKGKFHFELGNLKRKPSFSGKWDWESLRQDILTYGARNSLLIAPMPTASTSQILGNTECFEPWTSNIFLRRTSAGEFYICNSLLQRDLDALGLWTQENIDRLILQQGSVAQFPIPSYLKSIYKTVWEIPQRNLLEMAVERQFFIDQSQSLNIFVAEPSLDLLTKIHFYGWKNGLKTGCYYIRSRPPVSSINFAIDSSLSSKECVACSA